MHATELVISRGSELRSNKVALIGKEKQRRAVRDKVDAGSRSQVRDDIGLPHFTPRVGLQADKHPSGAGAVNKIISEKRRGGIAENAAGSRRGVRPENLGRRLIAGE